jgi:small subunit ribosomal protein S14
MAKKSKIARNEQRKVIVERYASKRLELKKTLVDPNATDEARSCTPRPAEAAPRRLPDPSA